MYVFGEQSWVPPQLVPRDGGYDVLRDGVLVTRGAWGEPKIQRPDTGPLVFDSLGRRIHPTVTNGGTNRYPLATMEIGEVVTVQPTNGKPKLSGLRSYACTKGKEIGRKYQVSKDGENLVIKRIG